MDERQELELSDDQYLRQSWAQVAQIRRASGNYPDGGSLDPYLLDDVDAAGCTVQAPRRPLGFKTDPVARVDS